MRAFKVYAIKNGTVIDHLPAGQGLRIIELLGLKKNSYIVTLGMNFTSKKHGNKDIVKVENKELNAQEVNKIAVIAPTATLNIIRDFKIVQKNRVIIPKIIEDMIKCANPNCVTNHEPVKTKFVPVQKKSLTLRCYFCERNFNVEELTIH